MRLFSVLFVVLLTAQAFGGLIALPGFPLIGGLAATLSFPFLSGQSGQKIYVGENIWKELPAEYSGANRYSYRLYKHKKSAPLIFLHVGLGGEANSAPSRNLAGLLYSHGFHVVVLSSTFNSEFAALAGSTPFVGIPRIDAYDLYVKMLAIKQQLPSKGVRVSGYGMMGYSYGALVSAFVSKLDGKERHFNFRKTLLINPPVNLMHGLRQLDRYYARYLEKTPKQRAAIVASYGKFSKILLQLGFSNEVFSKAMYEAQLSLADQEAIVGFSFRHTLKEVVYYSQIEVDLDVLKKKNGKISQAHAGAFGYEAYLHYLVAPFLTRTQLGKNQWKRFFGNRPFSIQALDNVNSLTNLGPFLAQDSKITVFHNVDDFLLRTQDQHWLEQKLGNRLFLFAQGGHLGNLWHPSLRAALVRQWQLAFQ